MVYNRCFPSKKLPISFQLPTLNKKKKLRIFKFLTKPQTNPLRKMKMFRLSKIHTLWSIMVYTRCFFSKTLPKSFSLFILNKKKKIKNFFFLTKTRKLRICRPSEIILYLRLYSINACFVSNCYKTLFVFLFCGKIS